MLTGILSRPAAPAKLWPRNKTLKMIQRITLLGLFLTLTCAVRAVIPSSEKLLPDDTLVVFTVPDAARLREITKRLPASQFWNDPAMKPFREHIVARWDEEFV